MNNLESQIYQIVDIVVECCVVECENGKITKEDVLSKCKKENATIARYMLTYHLRKFGLSNTTISQLFGVASSPSRICSQITKFGYKTAEPTGLQTIKLFSN